LLLIKIFIIVVLSLSYGLSKNLNYAIHDAHTLTIPKNQLTISYDYMLMNDTVDVLDIKEKEFGNSTKYDAIGDLNGHNIKLRYGILDDLMIGVRFKKEDIQYSSNTITNTNIDTYMRYNIFNHKYATLNSGLSFDIGYVSNKLDDFYMRDITAINDMIDRVLPNENAQIKYSDGVTPFSGEPFPRAQGYYTYFNNVTTTISNAPYVSLQDTKDESLYLRLLTGFYNKNNITDFYIGIKYTSIDTLITTTQEIIDLAAAKNFDLEKYLNRDEQMISIGMNHTLESKNFIYEFGFEYDKFIRDKGLNYIDFNYIIDSDISYKLTKHTLLFIGAKIMYRQLNGEIPYLYNEYSQTSYDHKYGYAKAGLQVSF